MRETSLPNNLRISEKGTIYCEDGQSIDAYLRKSPLFTARPDEPPHEIVIVSRRDYLCLCEMAWVHQHLLLAA